jgi:sterol desaturase/sphingolipid hydroxylase (fatty acid hydroxylase superfamily)
MTETSLQALLTWKGVVVGAWLIAFLLAERLAPAAPSPTGGPWTRASLARVARNAVLWLVNVALSPLVVVPLTAWAATVAPAWRPIWWSGPAGLLADLLLLDFLIYWWHRANHEVPFLWRFHRVHHLDATLDASSALRFHFGEVLLSALARAGVIVVLAVPLTSVLAFEGLLLLATIFHHSNLRLPAGPEAALARIVVTPSIHWVHHHKVRRDTDSNYATILSLWDPLFKTRSATLRRPDMPIGVEGQDERALAGLIVAPFVAR